MGFLGLGGSERTVTTRLDPASQRYVDEFLRPGGVAAMRRLRQMPTFGPNSFQSFFDPFQSEVIDATRADFDRQRNFALSRGLDSATRAGAGRSTRGGVLQAQLVDSVNRNEASALANLRSQGFARANQLALAAEQAVRAGIMSPLQAAQMGLGPTGSTTTESTSSNPFGQLVGLGATLFGAGVFGGGGGGIPAAPTPVAPGAVGPPTF